MLSIPLFILQHLFSPCQMTYVYRLAAVLTILFITVLTIVYAQGVIIPIYFSLLLAILLRRPVRFFEEKLRFNSIVAILFTELIAFSILLILFTAIIYQAGKFISDWQAISQNVVHHLANIQAWIADKFNISYADQSDYIRTAGNKAISNADQWVAGTVSSVGSTLFDVFLIPVYVFLFLVYHRRLTAFLQKVFGMQHAATVQRTLAAIRVIIQSYLSGLMIEMLVVASLNATGLFLLGVNYALFLGLMSAVLNLIPYIGTMIAGVLSVVVTLSSSDELSKVIGVIMIFWVVQLIDNNLLMPRIVGRKVKINALISITAVLVGGALAGVAGMFLSIPTIAILKVVLDHAEGTQAWGDLLGEDPPVERRAKQGLVRYILSSTWHPDAAPSEPKPEPTNENTNESSADA